MKNHTTNTRKAGAITMLLALSLSLGGCFQQVPSDKDSNGAPASSASASPSPSASPTAVPTADPTLAGKLKDTETTRGEDVKKAAAENSEYFNAAQKAASASPLGVDVSETVKTKMTPEAKATFAKFDVQEGARFSLDFYQKVIQKADFFKARDAAQDFSLLSDVRPMMTQEYQEQVEADIAEAGKFTDILTTDKSGSFGTDKAGAAIKPVTPPTQVFNVKEISVDGPYLKISGYGELTALTEAGSQWKFGFDYMIWAIPGAEGSWQISGLGWSGSQVN